MPYNVLTEVGAAVIPSSDLGTPLTSTGETLDSLRAELTKMLGGRVDVTPERLDLWINFAYIDLASSLDLDDLKGSLGFDLTAGMERYLLPAEVEATRGVAVIDTVTYGDLGGRALTKSDLDAYRMHSALVDEPREYFRERNLLILWPTPKTVRTIVLDFWITPLKLTANTHSPILPLKWHEAILLNARKKGYAALQEFEKAMVAENDFIGLVRRKQDRDEKEDEGRIVTSSVPRRRSQLVRRRSSFGDTLADLDRG